MVKTTSGARASSVIKPSFVAITGPPPQTRATSEQMPQPVAAEFSRDRDPDEFRIHLCTRQPELVLWLEQHVQGPAQAIAVELAARYVDVAERWGERMPILKTSRLNIELANQVPTISPRDRWLTDLPVAASASDRLAIGKLLSAIIATTTASLAAQPKL